MNINRDIRNILIAGLIGCTVFFVCVITLLDAFKKVNKTAENHDISLALARESSDNSFGLTNNVRAYVASGIPAFKDAYNEIIDIRSGKKSRPHTREVAPGETVTLRDLFRRAGFTQEEEALLNKANELSGALAQIESRTMDMVENASQGELNEIRLRAIEMLYGDEYVRAAREIQIPVEEFQQKLIARLSSDVHEVQANFDMVSRILLGLIILAALTLVGTIVWLKKRVLGTIGRIAYELDKTSTIVTDASTQIAENSRNVSETVAMQASSLAESSSAMEELAAMTRQNVESAAQTNQTTKDTLEAISAGSRAVSEMNQSMNEISDSAEQISRIIKTIEEIAFQTNLLALNAAVEAARAGESGKGFAVVADEVRNLAQRSAASARDTATLIETTVARVRNGAGTAARLADDFQAIEDKSRVIGDLIQSISIATEEQSKGMDLLNTAISEMDSQTQTTASNSRETAEASQQLTIQAASLNKMTAEIIAATGRRPEGAARGETIPVQARIVRDQPARRTKALGYSRR